MGSVTVHPRATHATEKCIVGERTQPKSQFSNCRTIARFHRAHFSIHCCTHFSIHGAVPWYRATLFVEGEPSVVFPPPHLPLSKLPSQKPQIPRTSCHVLQVVPTHSLTRPWAPFHAHRSASLFSPFPAQAQRNGQSCLLPPTNGVSQRHP